MLFSVENVVAGHFLEFLNRAKKTDLLDMANHYALTSVKPSMLKHEIKKRLIYILADVEILDQSALSSVLVTQTDLQLRELEVQRQIQLEKLRLERENSNGEIKIRNETRHVSTVHIFLRPIPFANKAVSFTHQL